MQMNKVHQKKKQKRPTLKYDYLSPEPFEIYIESKEANKNRGNYSTLGIANFFL